MKFRHQLAAYSPITRPSLIGAMCAATRLAGDPRPELRALLMHEYFADDALLCGSGTQALQLAIALLRRRLGGDPVVALPAFNCFDVVSAALGAGGPFIFYDLDPESLGPDEESLERALSAGARIVVLASMYGVPLRWDALEALAARHGAELIEDAAQGSGGTWRGRPIGSLGKVSTLSFGRGKGWTGGGGGAVLVRGGLALESLGVEDARGSDELKMSVALLGQFVLGRPALYGLPRSIPALGLGETTFKPPVPPRSMSRSAAAAILHNRRASALEGGQRKSNAASLLAGDADSARARRIRVAEGGVAGYLRLPVRLAAGLDAFPSARRLQALGVARSYPLALPDLPEIASRAVREEHRWPGADILVRELVTLPTHSLLTAAEREEIRESVLRVR